MAVRGSWVFVIAVCVVSWMEAVRADLTANAPIGQFFMYELRREIFQNNFKPFLQTYGQIYDDAMVFKCNKESFPDLPRWLRYTQRRPSENGFLYGTPLQEDKGNNVIEIFITNKRTFTTFKVRMVITVGSSVKRMPFQAEFLLPTWNIEMVLPSSVQDDLKRDVQAIWQTDRLDFVNITSALDRGGRVPLPVPGHSEGVYVKLGSDEFYSPCLLGLQTAKQQSDCAEGRKVDCSACAEGINCMTWCKSVLIDMSQIKPPPPAPTMGSGILESGGEFDPPESAPPLDFFPAFIALLIVPLILILLLCLVLTYIMCCRREGVDKRNAKTADIQLYHHHTIQDNTSELRSMAGGRSAAPQPLSTLPMFSTRTRDRASPSQTSDNIPIIMAQQLPNVDTPSRK